MLSLDIGENQGVFWFESTQLPSWGHGLHVVRLFGRVSRSGSSAENRSWRIMVTQWAPCRIPTTRYCSKMVRYPLSSWLKSTRIDWYKWRTHEAGTKRAGTVGGSQVCNGGRNRCLVPICCKGNSCPEHRRLDKYNFTLILTILAIGGEIKLCLNSITRQDGEADDTHGNFNDASDLVVMKIAWW